MFTINYEHSLSLSPPLSPSLSHQQSQIKNIFYIVKITKNLETKNIFFNHLSLNKPCNSLNPFIPESDQHLISPFNITPESNIHVMRIKEMIITEEPLDCLTNSPCQHFRKMYREQYGEYAY